MFDNHDQQVLFKPAPKLSRAQIVFSWAKRIGIMVMLVICTICLISLAISQHITSSNLQKQMEHVSFFNDWHTKHIYFELGNWGSQYKIYKIADGYDAAVKQCEKDGAYLIAIESKEELELMYRVFRRDIDDNLLTGLKSKNPVKGTEKKCTEIKWFYTKGRHHTAIRAECSAHDNFLNKYAFLANYTKPCAKEICCMALNERGKLLGQPCNTVTLPYVCEKPAGAGEVSVG